MKRAQGTLILLLFFPFAAGAATSFSGVPETIRQGDPIMVSFAGSASEPISVSFFGKRVPLLSYGGRTVALVGVPLNAKPSVYSLRVGFKGGEYAAATISVVAREKPVIALGIPEKLGGNTPASAKKLVGTILDENRVLASAKTSAKQLWKDAFLPPLAGRGRVIVTNPYGYTRETGAYYISHNGVDLAADSGTRVLAMNRGIVRIARAFRVYGNAVLIDHGLGVTTLYLHLSKLSVNEGELVERGRVVGESGESGYAEKPHLHLGVRLGGVAVDPIAFLSLFR